MARGPHSSGDDRGGREFAPPLRGGGFRLPGLKHWRLLRGLSQVELARRADLRPDYLWKVESGRQGCNPSAAQHLAELLKVDLLDLRSMMMRRKHRRPPGPPAPGSPTGMCTRPI